MKKKRIIVFILLFAFLFAAKGIVAEVNASDTIMVPADKALILDGNSKYIIIDQIDSLSEIPSSQWDSPTGTYGNDSVINITGNCQIGSTVPVKIGGISGDDLSTAFILEQSNISVDNSSGAGIDVGNLEVSHREATGKTTLNVIGESTGISFFNSFTAFHSQITAKGSEYGIYCKDEALFSGALIDFEENTLCTAEASGTNGIAIFGKQIYSVSSTIHANAPKGIAGIKMESSIIVNATTVNGNEIPSMIEAFSNRGRAITVGYESIGGSISVMNSKMYGETAKGEAGVHADSIYAVSDVAFETQAVIEGKADVGYGVVGQSLDSDQEFPSGGINCQDSIIKGHVNEGMGISSFLLSAQNSETASEIEGTAEKGLGISVCSAYIYSSKVTGISRGSSKKHFQVYDSIADSAGINYLSYFMVSGSSDISATAPMDDKHSFGIHGLLYSEDGSYRNGHMHVGADNENQGANIDAKGGVGIYVGGYFNTYGNAQNSTVHIRANGAVDGIQYDSIDFRMETGNRDALHISAEGKTGSGIRSLPPVNSNGRLYIDGGDIKASGAVYGINHESESEAEIRNSDVTATSSKGDALYFKNITESDQISLLSIDSSRIIANGKTHGLNTENFNVSLTNENRDSSAQFRADEVALLSTFTKDKPKNDISGITVNATDASKKMEVETVSVSVPPDQRGRKAAVVAPKIQVVNHAELAERYLKPIKGTISVIPYMAYAAGQNMNNPVNYNWEESSIPIHAADDGIYSDAEVVTAETIVGARSQDISDEVISVEDNGVHRIIMNVGAKKYTVTFDTDGGKPVPKSLQYNAGQLISKPTSPEKNGFKFMGWKDKETGKRWNFDKDLMPERDLTLLAVWSAQGIDKSETGKPDNQTPKTGDDFNMLIVFGIILSCALCTSILLKRLRQKR